MAALTQLKTSPPKPAPAHPGKGTPASAPPSLEVVKTKIVDAFPEVVTLAEAIRRLTK